MAGETIQRSGLDPQLARHAFGPILNAVVWTRELATTELELNDVFQVGYIPNGATLIGFHYYFDDLDSATSLVSKITVGSTDVLTGLTWGRSAGGDFVAIEPVTTTAATLVSWTVTTAPGGAQAGTFYLVPVYIGN